MALDSALHWEMIGEMDYFQPTELHAALRHVSECHPRILAGGTDVFPSLQNRPLPGPVLDLSRVTDLRQIVATSTGWTLGAGVTWSDILRRDLPPAFTALKQAAAEVGSLQIQNRATVAGNLCNASPAADGVPPLLILDAEVELASVHGTRRLPLDQFIRGNRQTALAKDELLTAIHVPDRAIAGESCFRKLGARRYLVISIAMVAVRKILDSQGKISACAIAVGSCSPVARRLRRLEQSLVGQSPSAISINAETLDGLSPIDDVRATAIYRRQAVAELLARAVREA